MRRREFIKGIVGSAVAAWPFAARAQQPTMPVIGSLFSVSATQWEDKMAGFRRGLGEAGFVDGRNVTIDYRWADGQLDRMATMAADLIDRKVTVSLAGGNTTGVRALIAATKTIPIVFTTAADPVATGLVASLSRPGGNVTGVTIFGGELVAKKLELLHEVVPNATQVAVLLNPSNPVFTNSVVQAAQSAARRLGLETTVINVLKRIPLRFEHSLHGERSSCTLLPRNRPRSVRSGAIDAEWCARRPCAGQPLLC